MKANHSWKHMAILLAVVVATVGPIVASSSDCPTQSYLTLSGHSVTLDPNQIALGPADANGVRQPLLLRIMTVSLGHTATDKIRACDPDGDPFSVTCQDGTLTADTSSSEYFTWTWTPTTIGVSYHWIEATDIRDETHDAMTCRGTIVVVTIPANRPPVLCGGLP